MTQYDLCVLDLVDGVKTQTEISRALHHGCVNGATHKALRSLEKRGYVIRDPNIAWSADWKWFRTEKRFVSEKTNVIEQPTLFGEE